MRVRRSAVRVWLGRPALLGLLLVAVIVAVVVARPRVDAGHSPGAGASPETPAIGINLGWAKDYSAELPFVDVFTVARPWIPSEVGGFEWDSGVTVPVDAQGWPLEAPFTAADGTVQEVKTLVMRELGFAYPVGTYTLSFAGTGTVELGFDASGVFRTAGTYAFEVSVPSEEGILVRITRSDPGDPIRDIQVIMPGFAAVAETEPFNPDFLARLEGFTVLRFADWTEIQGQPLVHWGDRPTLLDAQQASSRGVAYEWMIRLANTTGADAWVNVPHMADDTFVREMARLWARELDADRHLYLEYSNETWNPSFEQFRWIADQGLALGLSDDEFLAGVRFQAKRSAEIFRVFEEEFGGSERLVTVLNAWIAEPGLVEDALQTFALPSLNGVPINPSGVGLDALATAPYFGGSVGDEIVANGELGTVSVGEVLDRAEVALQAETLPYVEMQREIAEAYGLPLISYEGGQGLVGTGDNVWNEDLTALLHAANRHARMYELYTQLLDEWFGRGNGLFMAYQSVQRPTMWGSYGSLEYVTQPLAEAHKYRALVDRMARLAGAPLPPAVVPPAGPEGGTTASLSLPAGLSLVGWFGAPTTSAAILAAQPAIQMIWWLEPGTGVWVLDSRSLPAEFRRPIPIDLGTGFLVVVARATTLRVPVP